MEKEWKKTDNRFVAIFDIMGFKDMVQRESHDKILNKLEGLKNILEYLEKAGEVNKEFKKHNVPKNQTRSATFSDTIVLFSEGETMVDFQKIVIDSMAIMRKCLDKKIGIKGGLSYGLVTVDFKRNLFFGQPIIDAYLLHEDLLLYSAIFDNAIEQKFKTFEKTGLPEGMIVEYKVPLKSGKVTHHLIKYPSTIAQGAILDLQKLYETVSGKPRQYIDNTIDFLKSFEK